MKILIVDDETLIREWMDMCIKESNIPGLQTFQARTAEAALQIVQKENIDLLFTDITMPKMSGMEMIEIIRSHNHSMRIIVLTCHDEFELARQAIKLNVCNYLVKNELSKEDIIRVVHECASEMQQEDISAPERELERCSFSNIDSLAADWGTTYQSMVCVIMDLGTVTKLHMKMNDYIRSGTFFRKDKYLTVFVLETPQNHRDRILDILRDEVGIEIRNAGYIHCSQYPDPQKAFFEVLTQTSQNFWDCSHRSFEEMRQNSYSLQKQKLRAALDKSMIAEAMEQITADFVELHRNPISVGMLKSAVNRDFSDIYREFRTTQWTLEEAKECLEQATDYHQVLKLYREVVSHIIVEKDLIPSISEAVLFIESNYFRQISIVEVAEQVHLNKDYFSRLFKKELNITFTDYLTKIRMEKAKVIVCESSININEIGEMVGIMNPSYFTTLFTKYFGNSPSAMRSEYNAV